MERRQIEIVRDDEPRVAENREVRSIKVIWMIQDRSVELQHQMTTRADGDDLVGAIRRIKRVGAFTDEA